MKYLQDCNCMESEPFINDDNTPYCRWCGTNFKTNIMKDLAKKICNYNGQRGTNKQIEKCIKSFSGSLEIMKQFAKDRIV